MTRQFIPTSTYNSYILTSGSSIIFHHLGTMTINHSNFKIPDLTFSKQTIITFPHLTLNLFGTIWAPCHFAKSLEFQLQAIPTDLSLSKVFVISLTSGGRGWRRSGECAGPAGCTFEWPIRRVAEALRLPMAADRLG